MIRYRRTAGPVLTLALAAALAGPCWAQQDAAQGAGAPRSPLDVGPCLEAPGCGRIDAPLMPDASAALREALAEDAALAEAPQDPSPVPLPAALALLGAAMAAFALLRRRPAEV